MSSPAALPAQTADADLFDPTRSWVVTAGAGTGKTWRLARRYLRCLQHLHQQGHGDAAGRILAVTFTRAAAAEMRERVLLALQSGGKQADRHTDPVVADAQSWPEDLRVELLRQVAGAPIDTIHAFCARLLGAFPELSGVVPGVRPVEPDEDNLRRERFLRGFLDPVLDQPDHALAEDMRLLLGEFTLTEVRAMVATAVGADQELPEDLGRAVAVQARRAELYQRQQAELAAAAGPALERVCELAASLPPTKTVLARLEKLANLRDALARREWNAVLKAKRALNASNQKACLEGGQAFEVFEQACKVVDDLTNFRGNDTLLAIDPAVESAHCERLARILRLGLAARQAYADELASQGLMRFDDLERRAEALLQHPQAAQALAGRYAQLLVDEYQDTSPRQVRIITALERLCAAGGALATYKVGDLKQSIYRFRGAEVSVFRQTLEQVAEQQRGNLVETHRTRPDLASAFNLVFPRLLQGIDGEPTDHAKVPWSNADAIVTHRAASWLPGAPLQLMLACKAEKSKEDQNSGGDEGETRALETDNEAVDSKDGSDVEAPTEAAKVAAWIQGYLASAHAAFQSLPVGREGKRWESENVEAKPLQLKDIAILLPKWGEAEVFRQALQQRGIAAQVGGGRGLKARPEIRDLANLVAFLADPTDHVAAAGVLRGPLAGISDLGLYVLARWPGVTRVQHDGTKIEWSGRGEAGKPLPSPRPMHKVARQAVLDAQEAATALLQAGAIDAEQRLMIIEQLQGDATALAQLQALLNGNRHAPGLIARAGLEPTADLLTHAVLTLRLPQLWATQPEPARVLANVWRMIELIRGVESGGPDLQAVLAWLDGDADPTPEGLIDASGDAVTITTVHGAKGLEWRVVVLAGLHQQMRAGTYDLLKLDPVAPLSDGVIDPLQAQVVPRLKIPGEGFYRDDDPIQALATTLDSGLAAAEVKRLLYVGLTRAADRVVLSGVLKPSNVLTKREKEAATRQEVAPGLVWRTLEECSQSAQMLVSVLRLRPNVLENPTDWIADALPAPWAPLLGQALVMAPAGGAPLNGAVQPLPPQPTGAVVEEVDHCKPSKMPRHLWPRLEPQAGDGTELPECLAVPWAQDREMEQSPAESQLGLVLHGAMEHWGCKPEQFPDESVLRRLAIQYVPGGASLPLEWLGQALRRLANSPLGAEMASAAQRGELWHEVPLQALLQTGGAKTIALSGRIDAMFRDAQGQWVIVDYKLTRKTDPAQLLATYSDQLQAYRATLHEAGLTPVGRVGLWSAAYGVAIWA